MHHKGSCPKIVLVITSSICAVTLGFLVSASAEGPPAFPEKTTRADFEALGQYIGQWRTNDKTDQTGRQYYFLYELEYYDPSQTIAEMKISQVYENGESKFWWHGFYGWNAATKEAFYHGYSPMGRLSFGKIANSGDKHLAAFTGYNADGDAMELVDVFTHVEDDAYSNITYLKRDGEWQAVSRDQWRRVE